MMLPHGRVAPTEWLVQNACGNAISGTRVKRPEKRLILKAKRQTGHPATANADERPELVKGGRNPCEG
jgi:hypothetical protein